MIALPPTTVVLGFLRSVVFSYSSIILGGFGLIVSLNSSAVLRFLCTGCILKLIVPFKFGRFKGLDVTNSL